MARKTPPALGTINGYMVTPFWYKGVTYIYDGTPVGLTHRCVELGLKPGDTVQACFRNSTYVMIDSGGGDRTPNGWWMDKPRDANGRVISID